MDATLIDHDLAGDVDRSYLAYYLPMARPFQRLTSGHFPAGTITTPHSHTPIAMHGCLCGPLTLQTESQDFALDAGDFCLIPAEVEHSWLNPGRQTASTLAFLIETDRQCRWPAASGIGEMCVQLDTTVRDVRHFQTSGDEELQRAYWAVADLLTAETPQRKLAANGRIMTFVSIILDRMSITCSATREDDLAKQIRRLLLSRVNDRMTISDVARELGVSPTRAKDMFRATFGCGIMTYFNELKIWQAKRMLGDPSLTIEEIAYRMGFSSATYFSQTFRKHTGTTPSSFRSRGNSRGMAIT